MEVRATENSAQSASSQQSAHFQRPVLSQEQLRSAVYYDIPLDQELQAYVELLCSEYDFPFHTVMFGLIYTESNFNPNCYSSTHDVGLCQINESNFGWLSEQLGVNDLYDPYQNILCGVHILANNYHQTGDVTKALMAYQYGMGGAARLWANGINSTPHSQKAIGFANSLDPTSFASAPSGSFNDTASMSVDQKRAVQFVSQNGLMNGSDGNFNPEGEVSRAQLATILYRLQKPAGNYIYPVDIPTNAWYSNAAAWACSIGLMGQGSAFHAERVLSREDLAVVLYRFEKSLQKPADQLSGYSDGHLVSTYAIDALNWMVQEKIMGAGTPALNPQAPLSRMQLAMILLRWLS